MCDFLRCSGAQKFDETTHFAFAQCTEQKQGLYDHSHPDYARRDKLDLAWEKISHQITEPGIYIYFLIKT
jgi:hypothetical protein